MHMADALLSPVVGGVMYAASTGSIGFSVAKIKKEYTDKTLPLMAVSGAFVFAAQMINFTIPGTGSSGHIGGGILLAGLLGGYPALLAIASVLLIQCLFFADGGLLALGANIFNMGVIPCLLVYPLIYKPIVQKGATRVRITIASVVSAVVALQLGAFGVVLETLASGVTELPFSKFALLMQPIHLVIGVVEGLITAAVLNFVYAMQPELLNVNKIKAAESVKEKNTKKRFVAVVISLSVMALVVAGGLSLYASSNPDGLEWSIEKVTGDTELDRTSAAIETAGEIVDQTALMPDYDFASVSSDAEEIASTSTSISGTTVAGLLGALLTFLLAGACGLIIKIFRRKNRLSN